MQLSFVVLMVLATQPNMGAVFGIIGLFLAYPFLAMIKVALGRRAETNREQEILRDEA